MNIRLVLPIFALFLFSCCRREDHPTADTHSVDENPQYVREQANAMVATIMSARSKDSSLPKELSLDDVWTFEDYTNRLGSPIYVDSWAVGQMESNHWASVAVRGNSNIKEQGKDAVILEVWWGNRERWVSACFYRHDRKWNCCLAKVSPLATAVGPSPAKMVELNEEKDKGNAEGDKTFTTTDPEKQGDE